MLTRSMATKLTSVSASECLFVDFLSEIEPKKVSEALKHPGWVNAMKEELNQFYKNKVWTLVPLLYGKIAIGSKWVFRNKKDEHRIVTKNKARFVAQGYSQEEGINYFAPVARMEAIRIFLAFATYMNFTPPGFKSKEFPDYVCNLDKALSSVKTPMVPLNYLRPDLAGKPVNGTLYRGMIRGNVQPADKGLPSRVSNDGTVKTTPLPKGPHRDKESEGFKPPVETKPLTTLVVDPLGTDAKYQANQTQLARLRYQSLTKNKGETSFEVEPDNQTLLLSTVADVQALLLFNDELMEESEDEVSEARDEMDKDIHHTDEEETQSPLPNTDQPESSHAQDTKSDFHSTCPKALKKYDNWEKHEEAAASYADLKSEIKGFHDDAYKVHKGTKAAFSSYEKLLVKFQAQCGKDAEKILGSLKVIQDAIKEDPALNKKGLKSSVESLQASALMQDEHLAEWANSSTSMVMRIVLTKRGDGVARIKRRLRDLSSDDVMDLMTTLGRNRLKSDLEDSTW
ncbi:retrovirus-related pol polyprotein from transposon TNT 1-94 [Tanacetum coccineum]